MARINRVLGRSPVDVSAALSYRDKMMPVWVQQLQPDDPVDVSDMAPSLLRGLYPNVYYWGVRGDALAENFTRMLAVMDRQWGRYDKAARNDDTDGDWFVRDFIRTYRGLKLAKILVSENMRDQFDYVAVLKQHNLFEIAYRNVDVAEMNGENLFAVEEGTLLHRFYQHDTWDTAVYHDSVLKLDTLSNLRVVLSVFPRLFLSAPVMSLLPQFTTDFTSHAAFCKRWELTHA